jgi:acetyltransferase-like isoleucine patch superfamily enzyme
MEFEDHQDHLFPILPGVTLGDYTIVGAGSIVTKSFKDGYCVVAGNPARVIGERSQDLRNVN